MFWSPVEAAERKIGESVLLLFLDNEVSVGYWNGSKWTSDKYGTERWPLMYLRIDLPHRESLKWHSAKRQPCKKS